MDQHSVRLTGAVGNVLANRRSGGSALRFRLRCGPQVPRSFSNVVSGWQRFPSHVVPWFLRDQYCLDAVLFESTENIIASLVVIGWQIVWPSNRVFLAGVVGADFAKWLDGPRGFARRRRRTELRAGYLKSGGPRRDTVVGRGDNGVRQEHLMLLLLLLRA